MTLLSSLRPRFRKTARWLRALVTELRRLNDTLERLETLFQRSLLAPSPRTFRTGRAVSAEGAEASTSPLDQTTSSTPLTNIPSLADLYDIEERLRTTWGREPTPEEILREAGGGPV